MNTTCTLHPASPRQLTICSLETVEARLTEFAPRAYPILRQLLADCDDVILTGSVVAAAAGTKDESWSVNEWQGCDLDVFCTGESTATAVRLIAALMERATEWLWAHRGRVVDLLVYGTRIQIIHTGGMIADSFLATPADVLRSFDMTHLKVGLVAGKLDHLVRWRSMIGTGISEVVSADVLVKRVEKNLQRGYVLRFPASIPARGLQGYDGSHCHLPAPLGVDEAEHLAQLHSYDYEPAGHSPTLLSVWGEEDRVPVTVRHSWNPKTMGNPITAWDWLRAHRLPRASARLWWDLTLAVCQDVEEYRFRDTNKTSDRPLTDLQDLSWNKSMADVTVVHIEPAMQFAQITGYHGEKLLCITSPNGAASYYPLAPKKGGGYQVSGMRLVGETSIFYPRGIEMDAKTCQQMRDYAGSL